MAWTTLYNQEFRTKIRERAMKERLSLTPGTPRFTARRLENPEDKVSPEEHETELMKDMKKWALEALSDSDIASDKETRISVFGYIIYFCGIPIAWISKGMKSVVLSTTEAEYMALSEVVKEVKFKVQLLQTMNIEVLLATTVYVDDVGAIWLSNNRTTSDRTNHIDIRTSFVKEYEEGEKITIMLVKSEENEADIFTRNTTNTIFQNHN